MTQTPLNTYQDRRAAFAADLAVARKLSGSLSNARLFVVLASLAGFFWFIFRDDLIPSLLFIGVGALAFVALMFRHDKVLAREKRSAQLAALNEAGIDRIQGRWNGFPVDGREFADEAHAYASDLDLFGHSSLFQWMNAAQTHLGRLGLPACCRSRRARRGKSRPIRRWSGSWPRCWNGAKVSRPPAALLPRGRPRRIRKS